MHLGRADVAFILTLYFLHYNKKVYTVQKRIREFVLITLYLYFTASARFTLGKKVTARTRVLRSYEHDIRFIFDLGIDPGDVYFSVLKWFPKRFKDCF
jgi:hypothetical protein